MTIILIVFHAFLRPALLSASSCAHACACPSAAQYELLLLVLCSCEWGTLSHINTFAPSRDDQCCFIFISPGVFIHIRHQSQTDRVCKMSIWFFNGEDKCPITFLLPLSFSSYFFVTLGHCIADPVSGWLPMVQVYIWPINTATTVYF